MNVKPVTYKHREDVMEIIRMREWRAWDGDRRGPGTLLERPIRALVVGRDEWGNKVTGYAYDKMLISTLDSSPEDVEKAKGWKAKDVDDVRQGAVSVYWDREG